MINGSETMDTFSVHDGRRTLTFNGEHLSSSTSRRPNSDRWVEFELFRTEGGNYIISRVGQSLVYHGLICATLDRSDQLEIGQPSVDGVACEKCRPNYPGVDGVVKPERAREWAQIIEDPEGVINELYRTDYHGARFLTKVARDLIEDAAKVDIGIEKAYYTEWVN